MVKLSKLYTRTGDDGTTGLVGGKRTKKNSRRVNAYGDVDELNSYLGWARTIADANGSTLVDRLKILQNELFDAGSELATAPGDEYPGMVHLGEEHITRLEGWIDEITTSLPELRSFVLPGGTELNSRLHICRAVCRRAERSIQDLADEESVSKNLLIYFNRLSDFLFALARSESASQGVPEYLWEPGKKAS